MRDVQQAFARAQEAGVGAKRLGRFGALFAVGFFVIGLPWETRGTLEETYRFAPSLDLDFFDFNVATPLPGTELNPDSLESSTQDGEGTTSGSAIDFKSKSRKN